MWKKVLAFLVVLILILGGGSYLYARSIISRSKFDKDFSSLADLAKKKSGNKSTALVDLDKFDADSNEGIQKGQESLTVDEAKALLGINSDAEKKIEARLKEKNRNVKNVAVFGVDDFDGGGRSDSIIILSVDQDNRLIKIHSILRDSYVEIPGHGKDKINHAYAFGGPLLAVRTINENFDLNITDYISVSFDSLPRVIDYVGGVPVTLSDQEAGLLGLSPGSANLSGAEALSYSRIRYIDSDVQRSGRQREVMMGLLNKLLSLNPGQIPGTAGELMSLAKTNLNPDEVISLGTRAAAGRYSVVQSMSPREFSGEMIDGVYYNVFDIGEETEIIHHILFD